MVVSVPKSSIFELRLTTQAVKHKTVAGRTISSTEKGAGLRQQFVDINRERIAGDNAETGAKLSMPAARRQRPVAALLVKQLIVSHVPDRAGVEINQPN